MSDEIYSLDLQIHYCKEEDENSCHSYKDYNIGRKTFNECLDIINALGIKKYRFTKRERKLNYYELKYGVKSVSMVNVCILYVYVGEKC